MRIVYAYEKKFETVIGDCNRLDRVKLHLKNCY